MAYWDDESNRNRQRYDEEDTDFNSDWNANNEYDQNRWYGRDMNRNQYGRRNSSNQGDMYGQRGNWDYEGNRQNRNQYGQNQGNMSGQRGIMDSESSRFNRSNRSRNSIYNRQENQYGSRQSYDRGTDYGYGQNYDYDYDYDFDRPVTYTYTEYWLIPGPFSGQGPQGYQKSDDRILDEVCDRLTRHGQLDASDMEVNVNNGEVTLTGTVNDRRAKRMAEDTVESVSGVKDVHNELKVRQREHQSLGAKIQEGVQNLTNQINPEQNKNRDMQGNIKS